MLQFVEEMEQIEFRKIFDRDDLKGNEAVESIRAEVGSRARIEFQKLDLVCANDHPNAIPLTHAVVVTHALRSIAEQFYLRPSDVSSK